MTKAKQLPAYLGCLKYLWDTLYNSNRIFYLESIFLETFYFKNKKKGKNYLIYQKHLIKILPACGRLGIHSLLSSVDLYTKDQAIAVLHIKTFFFHIQNFMQRTTKVIHDPVRPAYLLGINYYYPIFKVSVLQRKK